MPNFTTRNIDSIKAKQKIAELVINGSGCLAVFENEIKGNPQYESEYRTILTYMEYAANMNTLPHTKFKDITPPGAEVKEYEFKSKHIRIYCIKEPNGRVVMMCGFKNTQKKDIIQFRSLKDQYLNSK